MVRSFPSHSNVPRLVQHNPQRRNLHSSNIHSVSKNEPVPIFQVPSTIPTASFSTLNYVQTPDGAPELGWNLGTLNFSAVTNGGLNGVSTAMEGKRYIHSTPPQIDDPKKSSNETKADASAFDLITAVSGQPKSMNRSAKSLRRSKSYSSVEEIPRLANLGEDAYFTLSSPTFSISGVADGVGGWSDMGVSASDFSWELMNCCKEVSQQYQTVPSPQDVLTKGYELLQQRQRVKAGSSTASILSFDKASGQLLTANLGDSGYLIIRDHNVLFKSKELQHYFNAPYQLAVFPPSMRGNISDTPDDAVTQQHELKEGDVVILATDGLFDNAYQSDILLTVDQELGSIYHLFSSTSPSMSPNSSDAAPSPGKSMEELTELINNLAENLTNQAVRLAHNDKRVSPFAKLASSVTGKRLTGGKVDDVTVLAGLVVKR